MEKNINCTSSEQRKCLNKILFGLYACANSDELKERFEEQILENNVPIIVYMLNRKFHVSKNLYDDMFQIASMAMLRAIRSFDFNMNIEFSTYACTVMERSIIREINGDIKYKNILLTLDENVKNTDEVSQLESVQDTSPLGLDNLLTKEKHEKLLKHLNKLPDIQQQVLKMYFGLDDNEPKSFNEISKILVKENYEQKSHYSRFYITVLAKKGLKRISNELAIERRAEDSEIKK